MQFRVLRGELAVSSIVGGKDVDFMYGAGTAITAAVRGLPMKVVSHDFKSLLFYLIGNPNVQSGQDLKGKKVAVASLSGTGALATRASLRALGVDPEKDVTLIVIGAASIRMAALEAGSVEAAIMPVPWNFRLTQKAFKELIFTGRRVEADEARAIGLVNHVVPRGQARARAIQLAAPIAENGPFAVRQAKRSWPGPATGPSAWAGTSRSGKG